MPSIIGKQRGDKTYYYLAESARVDGKPRIVSQEYLGSAEEVLAKLEGGGDGFPDRTRHRAFGDVAAVWGLVEDLDIVGIIDRIVGPRRSDAGASIGTYLALAATNRVVAPVSKAAFGQWWDTTALDQIVRPRIAAAALDHRRFWDAMHAVDDAQLAEIERAVTTRVIEQFDLDLSGCVLDMTNFATFIDSTNDKAPIAQRGKAKQKRTDLRLVGLALVVTHDGQVPVVSHTYPGNRHDASQFTAVLDALVTRWAEIGGQPGELTVTYDAGQNSADNHAHVEKSEIGWITSLSPSDHPDLCAIDDDQFDAVDGFAGVTAHDTTATALGVTRRAIVTHSQSFHDAQARGFEQTLAKARRQLAELQARLARGNTRKNTAAVQTEIDKILTPRWLDRVIDVTLTGDTPAEHRITWRTDTRARRRLEDELFGKRILFTGHDHWPVAQVIAGYRSQADVEDTFRQLKDPHQVSFSPLRHHTDHTIRVHTYTCVLALQLAHLLRRTARQTGHDMSVRALLGHLAGIQQTVLLYQGERGRPRARHLLTDMTDTQQALHDLFDLDRHAPRR